MKKYLLVLSALFIGLGLHAQATKKADGKDKKKAKKYEDIITKEAISDDGLFTVHKVKSDYYFEIPDSVLDKEILIVSRIAGFVKGLNFGGAGIKSKPQQVIRWQKKDESIMLRSVSYNSVASEEDPIYKSVENNNFEPVIMMFPIATYSKDSSNVVIKVNDLFTKDVAMISAISPNQKKNFGIRALDSKRSFISSTKSFPKNVEVRHVLTYAGGDKLPDNRVTGTMSVEMNQSFILLPEVEWAPRRYDDRVGYFSIRQTDYSLDEQKAANRRYITRWKLEPKDMEAYKRGELVEPVEPIVYYIDPATPEKWRPWLKRGVEDWQVAFEAAGFKNAIIAKDPPSPEEDPDWSPEDVRNSVIRYVSTDIQNAMGPHVHDPRTGQILESDIIWYHNVMNLLRNWFFIQTAAINPDAQKVKFDDDVMGRLIQFVSAHEVGHTLGLPHNMGSSVAYPVDSLRSANFTQKSGTAPSIMDYARFNYVAQPEDGKVGLMPDVGPYDIWSIKFGYSLFPGKTAEEEQAILNEWIKERASNPIYRYGRQRGLPLDPTAQTEDLGDDSMLASELGIKNLKRIVPNLIDWTEKDGESFADLRELYGQVAGQYRRYIGHVVANIGGVIEVSKTFDQDDVTYKHQTKEKQKRAVRFLEQHLFNTPTWMVDQDILRRIEPDGSMSRIRNLQQGALRIIFNRARLNRMIENEALNGSNAYSAASLFTETKNSIFRELNGGGSMDAYRRNLQRAFVSQMESLLMDGSADAKMTDIHALTRGTLASIKKQLSKKKFGNSINEMHLLDIKTRVEQILEGKMTKPSGGNSGRAFHDVFEPFCNH
ncbi:MAG: zinc-dependent metalloprotease [Bacteroidota bacterium]